MAHSSNAPLCAIELAGFCAQMSMVLKGGIPLREGLVILCEDTNHESVRALLSELCNLLDAGTPLSAALAVSGAFPKYLMDMVAIGEQSGRLDEVFDALSDYYEREENIRQAIKSAVTYPVIMLVMMLLVLTVLAVWVLPIFSQVFSQLGAELSAFSQGVLRLGSIMGTVSLVLVALLVIAVVTLLALRATSSGKRHLSAIFSVFPVTRRLSSLIATGRFAGAMAMMLQSGLDPDHALEMSARLVDHPGLAQRIGRCRSAVAAGVAFSDALSDTGVFSGLSARMISIGFKTGSVDTVMCKLAVRYEEDIDAGLSRLIGVVEPTMVAILSIAVGMVLLSVMLPLMGIMSSIG